MKQLGILDAAFINLEQPNTPQHVGGMGIYDPSTSEDGFVRFKQVIANFEHRLAAMPLFRTRLVEVPGGIDRPYFVMDDKFDVEFHLRHIALPYPGDWRQLCIQLARLHARPLDMSRPLWEAYIIEGLDNIPDLPKGSFAVYTKMHHCLVDGAGGQSFMAALHDLEPNPDPSKNFMPVDSPHIVDREPSSGELLTRALSNKITGSVGLVKGTVGLGIDLAKMGIKIARDEIPAPDINAPKTRLNRPVGPHRVFEAAMFSLDDFKTIKNAAGVTVNDVALGVISGALRKYLEHYDELPDEALAASMPLNMRTRRETTEDNNQVGAVFASLHTNVASPMDRLRAIHGSTQEAKTFGENSPMVDALKLAGVFSPLVSKTLSRIYSENELSRSMPMNISTVISNVPGPPIDLYCAGARLVRYHGLGLLTPGCGMFHLIFSSSGIVTMSVLADRDILPDPEFYRQLLEESFAELLEEAKEDTKPAVKKVKATASAKSKAQPKAKAKAKAKAKSKVTPKSKAKVAKKSKSAPKPKTASKAGKKVAAGKAKTIVQPKSAARKTSPRARPKAKVKTS
ncbi:MAG: wax ester/triacylglycerol synthase family O-acyltransferase [Pseudomonadales bacterium]